MCFQHSDRQQDQDREQVEEIGASDRNRFIASLRELIEKDVITPKKAFQLIDAVERGAMPLAQAYSLVAALLEQPQAR